MLVLRKKADEAFFFFSFSSVFNFLLEMLKYKNFFFPIFIQCKLDSHLIINILLRFNIVKAHIIN